MSKSYETYLKGLTTTENIEDYEETTKSAEKDLVELLKDEKFLSMQISSALQKINMLEETNEKSEDNLEKLYNINFEFQTDGAKKVYKSYLDMETITLDKLNESLDILKARKKELNLKKKFYETQETDLASQYLEDPDIFTKLEYENYLKSLNLDEDTDISGYQKGYKDYLQSDIPRKTFNLQYAMDQAKNVESTQLRAQSQRRLLNYVTGARLNSGLNDIAKISQEMVDYMKLAGTTKDDAEYLELGKSFDDLATQIGTQYGMLFSSQQEASNNSDIWYTKYADMFIKATNESGKNYTDYYYSIRDSYNYWKTLDPQEQKIHHALGGRYFGYNTNQFENFEDFVMSVAKDYARDTFAEFEDLGIIPNSTEPDDDDEIFEDNRFNDMWKDEE